jgi:hypothetical protein
MIATISVHSDFEEPLFSSATLRLHPHSGRHTIMYENATDNAN